MVSPMMMVLALQLLRAFQSFETEYLLGVPFGFYVYSTKIYRAGAQRDSNYGEATVLASITLLMIALIIPCSAGFSNGAATRPLPAAFARAHRSRQVELHRFAILATLLVLLTIGPMVFLILGSFMQRIGYFVLGFTLEHWRLVLTDPVFVKALRTTLTLRSPRPCSAR
jgi:ABC-type Fe3+ transport system permease subunit